MDYKAYEAVFNTGVDAVLVARFFDPDVEFTGGGREYRGREQLAGFLGWAHDGVREVMRPQLVLQDADHLFAEVDMDFHATKDRPDFPFGHMHPGDLVTVKFFVTYRLREGRIVELKSMTSPPERGVTKLPRLGAHPSQLAAFHSYVAAFSNGDCARIQHFYHPSVMLRLNDAIPVMHGPQAIADFYGKMFESVRETITILSVEATDDAVHLHANMRFTAIADAPDFVLQPLERGDIMEGRVFVDYTLTDGLISAIAVRRDGPLETRRAA